MYNIIPINIIYYFDLSSQATSQLKVSTLTGKEQYSE